MRVRPGKPVYDDLVIDGLDMDDSEYALEVEKKGEERARRMEREGIKFPPPRRDGRRKPDSFRFARPSFKGAKPGRYK